MLRTIHLTGKLAKYSKKPIKVEAESILMTMQCLFNMFGPRFKQTIRDGEWHLTRNKKLKECTGPDDTFGEEELAFNMGSVTEVWLCPRVKANKAAFRIIVGIILIVVGVMATFLTAGQSAFLIAQGVSLVLGGVAELLAPKPQMGDTSAAGEQVSYMFNGTMNTNESGVGVPIIYGRVNRASSIVLSAGFVSEQLKSQEDINTEEYNKLREAWIQRKGGQ